MTREIHGNVSHLAPETVTAVKVHDKRQSSDALDLRIACSVLCQLGKTGRDRKPVRLSPAILLGRRIPHFDRQLAPRPRFFSCFDRANADRIFSFYKWVV